MAPESLVIIPNHQQYIICTNHLPGFMYLPQVQKSGRIVDLILNNEHLCRQPSFIS